MSINFRLELSFKDIEDLDRKIQFCINNNIYNLNIPCKGKIKKEFLKHVIDYIGLNFKKMDVTYHYSCKHQFSRTLCNSFSELSEFISKCIKYNTDVLLISGANKKKDFDSIKVLNYLNDGKKSKINYGIAYNPYFEEYIFIEEERKRLFEKLNTGIVSSIWLQFGSDINLLEKELIFLKQVIKTYSKNNNSEISLYGSLFIPTKQFLARFKFRPWKSVFLSKDYLSSLDYSYGITKNIIDIYSKNNIFPLVESQCSSTKELNKIYQILTK